MANEGISDPHFGHWLGGFLDGEGCFAVHFKDGAAYRCSVHVNLRQDDVGVLREIQDRVGGNVYTRRSQGKFVARWTVNDKDSLRRLRFLLRGGKMRAKKARDYALWSEALDLVYAKGGQAKHAARLAELKAELHAVKRFDPVKAGIAAE